MSKILSWLHKPYPFTATTKSKILISLGFGKFIFLFLYIFQPFNFGSLEEKDLLFALMFGLITMLIMLINNFLFPFIFPKFFDLNKWVVYKMIIFVFGTILIIGVINWFFFSIAADKESVGNHSLSFFMSATALIGFFPLLFYLYISEKIKYKEHKKIADSISKVKNSSKRLVQNDSDTTNTLSLFGENKKESFELNSDDLLYISYEKNYSSVYYKAQGKVKEELIRISLGKLEKQLANYKNVVRCHKSYIVNTYQVEEIQGNARSYMLKVKANDSIGHPILIPVSRSFPKEMLFTLVG